ncbi:MAG: RNA methyltransferase [Flavobacteriales bacterium]|nr:MAG: RNA methyltransferase [Flavobacteriales bacterium]
MVVKNQIKFIKSLQQKKYRNEYGMFVAEGLKTVGALLDSHYKVEKVYTTQEGALSLAEANSELITQRELHQMSAMKHPNTVLAVFHIPKPRPIDYGDWIVALDTIADPGNLGTIIRLCDWFGIGSLVCSLNSVDCYNPKVLQATMGSIAGVNIGYTDLESFCANAQVPIYGTFMDGKSVYSQDLTKPGILLMGNEANGISAGLEDLVSQKISIPKFGGHATESLNVAMATAILLNEIRRR